MQGKELSGCYLRCFHCLNDAKVVGEVLGRRVPAGNALRDINVRRVWIQHALCGWPASSNETSHTALLASLQQKPEDSPHHLSDHEQA